MRSIRPLVNLFSKQVRFSSHGKPADIGATMNEMPVPMGSWQEAYNQKQKGYNAALVAGVVVLTLSIVTARTSGLLYFNFSPPKSLD